MSEMLKDAAYTAGKHAADSGLPMSTCPLDPGDSQPEQVYALWWLRGYRSDNEPVDQPAEGEGA